ncbi:hypothetical protein V6N13_051024 [Hibiscus sabdariffa]
MLRRLEARFVKQLKRLRHYDSNIGLMPGMINRAEYRSSCIVAVKSCTEATWSIKAQNLLMQSFGPDFSAPADKRSIERDFDFINIFFFNVPVL